MVRIWLKAFLAVALVVSGSAWLIAQERAQEVDEAEFRVREAKRIREQLNSRGLRTPACDSVLNSTQDPTQLLETKLRPLQAPAAHKDITAVVEKLGVPFPVCGYTDHEQTKRWEAEGVPLTVLFDEAEWGGPYPDSR